MLITVNGLVARSYPTGNHDRVIQIITPDHGRLSVMIKGGSSGRSGTAASCTQLFTYGNYELYQGKGGDLYWYRGGSVTRSFYGLSTDLARMALATYLCDLTAELTGEEHSEEETEQLLRMLLNSLHALEQGGYSPEIVKAVFELRAASLMGYCPDLTGCSVCGEGYPEQAYFDIMNGRLICADCQTKRNRLLGRDAVREEAELGERRVICPVSPSTLAAMRYALTAPDKKIFSFSLKDREEEMSFGRAAETFLLNQLERDFDTLRFYRSVVI
ncbi:MAG: DNA repair protein RecO [Clostridia bacterium]|nr:DNA repair protein RecO [Clostridia bacterium]